MGKLTYNLIVRLHSNLNGIAYWRHIQELAKEYGIEGSFILVGKRVMVVNSPHGTLEYEVQNGRPYSQIPQVIRDYEATLKQTDAPRWVIVTPSKVERVKNGLSRAGVLKGAEFFYVVVGEVYDKGNLRSGQAKDLGEENPRAKDVTSDPVIDKSADLIDSTRAQEHEAERRPSSAELSGENSDRPTLAELIKRVSK